MHRGKGVRTVVVASLAPASQGFWLFSRRTHRSPFQATKEGTSPSSPHHRRYGL